MKRRRPTGLKQFPHLIKEWHSKKNGDLTPDDVTYGSSKKVWWKCEHGHEWQAAVHNRTSGTGCPHCAGKRLGPEHRVSNQPTLAKEWHPGKNGDLNPEDVTTGSHKKVWWKCERGHEWQAVVRERYRGAGCPVCAGRGPTPEVNLRTQYPEIAEQWHPEKNGDLAPEHVTYGSNKKVWWKGTCGHEWKTAVKCRTTSNAGCPICFEQRATPEDNLRAQYPEIAREWHPVKNGDLTPEDVTHGSGKKVWWKCRHGHEWQAKVGNRTSGTGCPYCAGKRGILHHRVSDYPTLVREWHPVKNRYLKPEQVTRGSHKKVWWKCERGHEWQAAVKGRTYYGIGCPYCAGQRPCPEHNLSNYPALVREWHPEKNGALNPEDLTPGSTKKVWWKCERGHEWAAVVKSRTNGAGCPVCAKSWATPKVNLRVQYPDIAEEWHPEKNGSLNPEDVTHGSSQKVWWKCKLGHEWQAAIANRTSGSGCPYCSGRRACPENNLSNYPVLAHEWHPKRNGTLTPERVTPGSGKEVWWKGDCGHEWKAAVRDRTSGADCPICAKRRATRKDNLRTRRPDIAKEWHPDMNGDLTPEAVTPVSKKRVWWMCARGHIWQAEVLSRTYLGSGCPYCAREGTRVNRKLSDSPALVQE
ncbi:MAG: zinc-ribbon domain-containing protein [Desulfomonilaceae bacterium]|nr:zinc-ribbon domain-containing protein [Desulfomonilaceae bacterium]